MIQQWIDAQILIRSATLDGYPFDIEGPGGTFTDGIIPLAMSAQVQQQWAQLEAIRPYGFSAESEAITQMRALGEHLYRVLNGSDNRLRRALDPSLVLQTEVIRLQLRIRDTEARTWPWELLCDELPVEEGQAGAAYPPFLALSRNMLLSRYHEQPIPIPKPEHLARLRILVVIATPRNYGALGRVAEEELAALRLLGATSNRIDLRVIEHASPESLLFHLTAADLPFHILHFIGHGYIESSSSHTPSRTGIVLETIDGHGVQIGAADFARLLIESQNTVIRRKPLSFNPRLGTYPHLVTLDACHSARAELSSVASELMQYGVPAVIGMQSTVSPAFVILFNSGLYAHLIDGWPIDQATAETRRAMQQHFNRVTDWYIPMLSVRAADGILFTFSSTSQERTQWLADLERINDLAGIETMRVTGQLVQLGATAIPLLVAAVLMGPLAAIRIGAAQTLRRMVTKPDVYDYVAQLLAPALEREIDPEIRRAIACLLAQPRISAVTDQMVKRLRNDADQQVRAIVRMGQAIQQAFAEATTESEIILMVLSVFSSAFENQLLQRIGQIRGEQEQLAAGMRQLAESVVEVLTEWIPLHNNLQSVVNAQLSLEALAQFLKQAEVRALQMTAAQFEQDLSPEVDQKVAATNRALAAGYEAAQATVTLLDGLRLAHVEARQFMDQEQTVLAQIDKLIRDLVAITLTNGLGQNQATYTISRLTE